MKELLLKYIVSKARECTTFSMNTGPNFDPWNIKSDDFFCLSDPLWENPLSEPESWRESRRLSVKFVACAENWADNWGIKALALQKENKTKMVIEKIR